MHSGLIRVVKSHLILKTLWKDEGWDGYQNLRVSYHPSGSDGLTFSRNSLTSSRDCSSRSSCSAVCESSDVVIFRSVKLILMKDCVLGYVCLFHVSVGLRSRKLSITQGKLSQSREEITKAEKTFYILCSPYQGAG